MDVNLPELVAHMRQGEFPSLGLYIEHHKPQLMAYINKHLGPALRSKVEPDDILQETTVAAMHQIHELAGSDRDPFGWLCQIAEHKLVDAHRRLFAAQKRSADREVALGAPGDDTERSPIVDLLVASFTTPSQAFSRNQNEILLHEALATLPDDGREALRLRYAEGLSSKEIAERLNRSDAAVRVLLSRTLARLQETYDGSPPR